MTKRALSDQDTLAPARTLILEMPAAKSISASTAHARSGYQPNAALALLLCAIAIAMAYSNSLRNAFALDDFHSIVNNPWVRSLEHIPRYFTDAGTFTVLKVNTDYRPVLQTTYAINYAISGYNTWSWHVVNLLLHLSASVSIFLLGRRLFGTGMLAPLPGLKSELGDWAALAAAVIFAVHPITTGCANYIGARSSLLVAALLLPAMVLHLKAMSGEGERRRTLARTGGALLLYTLALFTKVEAISFAAVLVLAEILLNPALRDRALWRRPLDMKMWLRLAPFLAMSALYLVVWKMLSPLQDQANRAAFGMTPWVYFMTQWSAWWHYVAHVFAPVHFVADELAFPIAQSPWDMGTMLALEGWLIVGGLLLLCARRAPAVTFLGGAFFLYLAPHSSVIPLAEMVNEHRPYLPVAGVFLLVCAGGFLLLQRVSRRPALIGCAIAMMLAIPLGLMTRDRNTDWKDDFTLWQDTAEKTPTSSRAQMNYGLALMNRGQYDEAERRFRETIELAPQYHYAYSNLAIVLDAMGDTDGSAQAHDLAVQFGPASDVSYYWRGRFRAKHRDYDGAIADFTAAAERSGGPIRELAALVETLIRAGRQAEAGPYAAQGAALGAADFEVERAQFKTQVLGTVSAQEVMAIGLDLMQRGEWAPAETRFREALRLDPTFHYAATNLGIALAGQKRFAEAAAAHAQAVAIAPNQPSPHAWRAKFRDAQGDLPGAIEDYRKASELNQGSVTDMAALADALIRAGRMDQAREVVTRGEVLSPTTFTELRARLASGSGG